jgi:hypothetical protein
LPILLITGLPGPKQVFINIYQPIQIDGGKVFLHHLNSLSFPMNESIFRLSLLKICNDHLKPSLESQEDLKAQADGSGHGDFVIEIAVWDSLERRIMASARGEYGIVAD